MPTCDNHMENFALKLGIGAIYVAERQHFGLKPHNSTHMGLPGANISIKPRKKCISSRFIAKQSPQVVVLWPYLHSNRVLQQNLMLKYKFRAGIFIILPISAFQEETSPYWKSCHVKSAFLVVFKQSKARKWQIKANVCLSGTFQKENWGSGSIAWS